MSAAERAGFLRHPNKEATCEASFLPDASLRASKTLDGGYDRCWETGGSLRLRGLGVFLVRPPWSISRGVATVVSWRPLEIFFPHFFVKFNLFHTFRKF